MPADTIPAIYISPSWAQQVRGPAGGGGGGGGVNVACLNFETFRVGLYKCFTPLLKIEQINILCVCRNFRKGG